MRAIDVACGQREDAVAFALLGACGELRNLTVRLARVSLVGPGAPLWVKDGVACLLALSGLEEVRFGESSGVVGLDLREGRADAVVLRRELMKPRGAPGELE